MKKILISIILILSLLFTVGCQTQTKTTSDIKTIEIGSIMPLTGDGAVYGTPIQKVIKKAVDDVNLKWKDKKLKIHYEDGKCNGKDALTSAQTLVNLKGMKIILGGFCSGETLGAAPFAEQNKVVMLSMASTSPKVTNAGDYIFRNVGSDAYQAVVAANNMKKLKLSKVAILSENTDYAQDLRKKFKDVFSGTVVADEVINSNEKDVRTQVLKIKSKNPDVLFLIPQTTPMANIFVKQANEGGLDKITWFGSDVYSMEQIHNTAAKYIEGLYFQRMKYDTKTNKAYLELKNATGCDLGFYCAASYDSVLLLSEILEKCGDKDAECVKKALYTTQNWMGKHQGKVSFDKNGDIPVEYEALQIKKGKAQVITLG